jgi:hypothetical protein
MFATMLQIFATLLVHGPRLPQYFPCRILKMRLKRRSSRGGSDERRGCALDRLFKKEESTAVPGFLDSSYLERATLVAFHERGHVRGASVGRPTQLANLNGARPSRGQSWGLRQAFYMSAALWVPST